MKQRYNKGAWINAQRKKQGQYEQSRKALTVVSPRHLEVSHGLAIGRLLVGFSSSSTLLNTAILFNLFFVLASASTAKSETSRMTAANSAGLVGPASLLGRQPHFPSAWQLPLALPNTTSATSYFNQSGFFNPIQAVAQSPGNDGSLLAVVAPVPTKAQEIDENIQALLEMDSPISEQGEKNVATATQPFSLGDTLREKATKLCQDILSLREDTKEVQGLKEKVLLLFRKAASLGSEMARLDEAWCHEHGFGTEVNYELFFNKVDEVFRAPSVPNNVAARAVLMRATAYRDAKGVDRDPKEARRLIHLLVAIESSVQKEAIEYEKKWLEEDFALLTKDLSLLKDMPLRTLLELDWFELSSVQKTLATPFDPFPIAHRLRKKAVVLVNSVQSGEKDKKEDLHQVKKGINLLFGKASLLGSQMARLDMAWCYENGFGTEKNTQAFFNHANAVVTEAIALNDMPANVYGRALYMLATAYEKGKGVAVDSIEAQKWFKKAADMGHLEAQEKVAAYKDKVFLQIKNSKPDTILAMDNNELLQIQQILATSAEPVPIADKLLECAFTWQYKLPQFNREKAVEIRLLQKKILLLFEKAMLLGQQSAIRHMIWYYENKFEMKMSTELFKQLNQLANSSDPAVSKYMKAWALRNMALCYIDCVEGLEVTPDYVKAKQLLKQAANWGDSRALELEAIRKVQNLDWPCLPLQGITPPSSFNINFIFYVIKIFQEKEPNVEDNAYQRIKAAYGDYMLEKLKWLQRKLTAVDSTDDKLIFQIMQSFFKAHWEFIKGSYISYTAMPTAAITRALCYLARLTLEFRYANDPRALCHAAIRPVGILELLIPDIRNGEPAQNDFSPLMPVWDKKMRQWGNIYPDTFFIFSNFIWSRGYLIPVHTLMRVDDSPSWQVLYNEYFNLGLHPEEYIDPNEYTLKKDELRQLFSHSPEAHAVFVAKQKLHHMAYNGETLLLRLNRLVIDLRLSSKRGTGGTYDVEPWIYPIIDDFLEYYDGLGSLRIQALPDEVKRAIEFIRNPRILCTDIMANGSERAISGHEKLLNSISLNDSSDNVEDPLAMRKKNIVLAQEKWKASTYLGRDKLGLSLEIYTALKLKDYLAEDDFIRLAKPEFLQEGLMRLTDLTEVLAVLLGGGSLARKMVHFRDNFCKMMLPQSLEILFFKCFPHMLSYFRDLHGYTVFKNLKARRNAGQEVFNAFPIQLPLCSLLSSLAGDIEYEDALDALLRAIVRLCLCEEKGAAPIRLFAGILLRGETTVVRVRERLLACLLHPDISPADFLFAVAPEKELDEFFELIKVVLSRTHHHWYAVFRLYHNLSDDNRIELCDMVARNCEYKLNYLQKNIDKPSSQKEYEYVKEMKTNCPFIFSEKMILSFEKIEDQLEPLPPLPTMAFFKRPSEPVEGGQKRVAERRHSL